MNVRQSHTMVVFRRWYPFNRGRPYWDRGVAWSILPARGAGDSSSNLGGPTFNLNNHGDAVVMQEGAGPWGSLVDPSGFGSLKLQFESGRSHSVGFSQNQRGIPIEITVGPWGSLVHPSGFGSLKLQFESGRSHCLISTFQEAMFHENGYLTRHSQES